MKKLKPNQVGPWCSFCPPKTVRAIYRQNDFGGNFCCEEHKQELKAKEDRIDELNGRDLSEADYQTWMRL